MRSPNSAACTSGSASGRGRGSPVGRVAERGAEPAVSPGEEICRLSIHDLLRAYSDRSLTPLEVTRAYLARIADLDPILHAYITVTGETALADAAAATRRVSAGAPRGALDGIPLGLKDVFDVAGVPTTGASRVYAAQPAGEDALAVARLRSAGAILLGKHTLHELAAGGPSDGRWFPAARNPWDLSRLPGGSSSGSACAVAAGLCAGAFGTDTGGSVRWPASYCGIVGFKPTYDAIPRTGVIPLSWTLDHCGPLARTTADARSLFHVAAARAPRPRKEDEVRPADLRVGTPLSWIEATPGLDEQVFAAYQGALDLFRANGGTVTPLDLPGLYSIPAVRRVIVAAEVYASHGHVVRSDPDRAGARLRRLLAEGSEVSAAEYRAALRKLDDVRTEIDRAMERIDVLVTPTMPFPAWSFAEEFKDMDVRPYPERARFVEPFDLTGQPAISLPWGLTPDGLPIGVQLASARGRDDLVLSVAHTFEETHGPLGAPRSAAYRSEAHR